MRVLLIGALGMLGKDVETELLGRGANLFSPSIDELDITNPPSVAEAVSLGYDWVVNCAAYTAVDKAESEYDEALKVNGLAPGYLGRACAMAGSRLLHVSTDFVFDGAKSQPYVETDPTNPLGAYGRSKREGEEAVMASGANALIVRTAWLFGVNGPNFPKTMIRAAQAGRQLRVVADQTGSPTYTVDLARVMGDLMQANAEAGIYHAAGPDILSWHKLAEWTVAAAGIETRIEPIRTEDWPTPAPRPAYSALSFSKCLSLGIEPMRPTRDALAEFVANLTAS